MGGRGDEDELSSSDHRQKRRKTHHAISAAPNGMGQAKAPSTHAAPNSFAAKMMAKMGYVEGQGLGATGRGRLAPIETQLRPTGAGLGAVKEKTKQAKEEEKREAAFRGQVLEESSDEERKRKKKLKEKRISGVGSGAGTPGAKGKPKYRTASELQAETEGLEVPESLISIYDATGQSTRVISSTAGLMSHDAMVLAETEQMKIARRARRDLDAFADEWKNLENLKQHCHEQEAQASSEIQRNEEEQRVLEGMVGVVQELESLHVGSSKDEAAWDSVVERLESAEHLIENAGGDPAALHEIAIAAVHPLFKLAMQEWQPLQDPTIVTAHLERLRDMIRINPLTQSTEIALQNGNSHLRPQKSTTAYETMIHTLWLPPVRSAIINDWDVYDPKPLTTLLDTWKPLLPSFVLAHVIDQLVVRRLTSAVSAWRPKKTQSHSRHRQPHHWLFPWLPYLDIQHVDPKSPTGLLSDVKRKFKSVLSTWDIRNGVLPGLEQWRLIFRTELSILLVRYLLPRLAEYLEENFVIDPSDQNLTPLEEVMKWKDHLQPSEPAEDNRLMGLFPTIFFPKWHNTLYLWLTSDAPVFDEVQQWYQWWKQELEERFPGLNEHPSIVAEWEKALGTLNLAVDALENGLDVSTQLVPPSAAPSVPPTQPAPMATVASPNVAANEAITTFKDVVEDWCAENGLLMVPLREAEVRTGLPLFRITASSSGKGGVVAYFKGDIIWVRDKKSGSSFAPMGLDDVLATRAENK
ncbi:hypothetical protein MMC21_006444 [Puttea exsequens]|nr:hypothetical protein [Puttea exsequens]